jgi:hypothetical protein
MRRAQVNGGSKAIIVNNGEIDQITARSAFHFARSTKRSDAAHAGPY